MSIVCAIVNRSLYTLGEKNSEIWIFDENSWVGKKYGRVRNGWGLGIWIARLTRQMYASAEKEVPLRKKYVLRLCVQSFVRRPKALKVPVVSLVCKFSRTFIIWNKETMMEAAMLKSEKKLQKDISFSSIFQKFRILIMTLECHSKTLISSWVQWSHSWSSNLLSGLLNWKKNALVVRTSGSS